MRSGKKITLFAAIVVLILFSTIPITQGLAAGYTSPSVGDTVSFAGMDWLCAAVPNGTSQNYKLLLKSLLHEKGGGLLYLKNTVDGNPSNSFPNSSLEEYLNVTFYNTLGKDMDLVADSCWNCGGVKHFMPPGGNPYDPYPDFTDLTEETKDQIHNGEVSLQVKDKVGLLTCSEYGNIYKLDTYTEGEDYWWLLTPLSSEDEEDELWIVADGQYSLYAGMDCNKLINGPSYGNGNGFAVRPALNLVHGIRFKLEGSGKYSVLPPRTEKAILATAVGTLTGEGMENVPWGTKVSDFKAGLTISAGATAEILESDEGTAVGNQESTDVTEDMKIRVTAEDGTWAEYGITLEMPLSTEKAILTTATGTLTGAGIENVPWGTKVSDFKAGLTISAGATAEILESDEGTAVGNQESTDVTEDMKIRVTAEDGTWAEYAITLEKILSVPSGIIEVATPEKESVKGTNITYITEIVTICQSVTVTVTVTTNQRVALTVSPTASRADASLLEISHRQISLPVGVNGFCIKITVFKIL